jgi:pimeloyl-ACP methyl ester carboxylesterase
MDTTRSTVERVGDCASADVIYIFVHGAGGSRAMFREHAAAITARVPHCGTVLLDLPGHGARHAEPCNALACIDEVLRVARNAKASRGDQAPRLIYVGGSLGGYVGMEAMKLAEFATLFDAAAILGCGQGVGRKDAGVAARLGLVAMASMPASVGKTGMVRAMVTACKANKHLDSGLVWRTCFTPGMFFDQSDAHVEILRGTDPAAGVAAFAQTGAGRRVLFMHGSKDYASNQAALNEAAGACGRAVVVTDGDHFFTHDERFFDLVMDELGRLATPGEVWGTTA